MGEPLEWCNLPGLKYPSDHFAHMAIFEECFVDKHEAMIDEMCHLLKREKIVPSEDREVQGSIRVDYVYKCGEEKVQEFTEEEVIKTLKRCRPFYADLIQENGENYKNIFDKFIEKSSQSATYVAKVKEQAKRMNVHNSLRNDQEREGAAYRTYAILKALNNISVALKGKIGFNTTEGKPLTIGNATAKDLREFVENFHFKDVAKCPVTKYKKFGKVPISEEELETHITAAKQRLKAKLKPAMYQNAAESLSKTIDFYEARNRQQRRRLADAARMEEKDVDAMSPSELVLHRRRLSGGARVSPVLAVLMEQIEEAQRNH